MQHRTTPDADHPRTESYLLPGGAFRMVSYNPGQVRDPVPVVLVPGWAITRRTLEPAAEELAQRGRRVLALESRRSGADGVAAKDGLTRAADATLIAARLGGQPHVDAVAQSAGAHAALLAAQSQPQRFRSIVLVDPAGLQGAEDFCSLALRFHAHIAGNIRRAVHAPEQRRRALGYQHQGALWIARAPVGALRDAAALAALDLRPLLLEAQSNGIRIGIIHGAVDSLMPMAGVQSTVTRAYCDLFLSVQGEHHELFIQAERYAGAASIALDLLAHHR